ncbi:hypothetical protein GCM10022419_046770 [Nonomuraea rosea]|uniref:Uncharacterized protein n=1 Tax=Nonomuraea rosea TaxID=638574 RepID=A0ABP6X5R5_9ACTN
MVGRLHAIPIPGTGFVLDAGRDDGLKDFLAYGGGSVVSLRKQGYTGIDRRSGCRGSVITHDHAYRHHVSPSYRDVGPGLCPQQIDRTRFSVSLACACSQMET